MPGPIGNSPQRVTPQTFARAAENKSPVQPPADSPAEAKDVASISKIPAAARPKPNSSGLGKTARAVAMVVAFASIGGLMTGCGKSLTADQLGPPVAQQTVQQDQAQAMRFEVVPNSVRVDVIRQTHEETTCSSDKDGEHCTTTTVDDPYQPVGVYLGKGLFLDAGMNLSVVPDRVFHGPLVPQDFKTLTDQGPFGSWSRMTAHQEGNTVGISQSMNFFDNSVVRDNPDQTTLKLGTFKSLQKFNNIVITRHGQDLDIQAWAPKITWMQDMARVEIRTHGDEVTVHPYGYKSFVDTKIDYSPNKVVVQPWGGKFSKTEITKGANDAIEVNHWGLGKESTQRGANGLNETETSLGMSSRANLQIQGNVYNIHEPGGLGNSTITVQP